MKKIILLIIIAMFACFAIAQEPNYKFGEVSREEVEMETYQLDTSAVAVILKMEGYTQFDFKDDDLDLYTIEEYRIKILKDEGVEYANITIPYHNDRSTNGYKENILSVEAVSYNMEGRKVVSTKISRKEVLKELVSDNNYVAKFTIPNVKKGTVIEYKFKRTFNVPLIEPWIIQREIPVKYFRYETHIPDYFHFGHEIKGSETVEHETSYSSATSYASGSSESIPYKDVVFTAQNIPAMKEIPFVWSFADYYSAIEFELVGLAIPGQGYQNLSFSWAESWKQSNDFVGFGGKLRMTNPLYEQTQLLKLDSLSVYDKSVAVFSLLKEQVKWNGTFSMISEDISETITQGTGSNADINFIYMSMLKDVGVESTPVLLLQRSLGRMPMVFSANKLNTFVVMIKGENGENYFMDGSSDYGDINLISPELMIEKGIVYDNSVKYKEVDLSKVGVNIKRRLSTVKILADGSLEGTRVTSLRGQFASSFKKTYANSEDELDFIQNIEENSEITIDDFSIEGSKTTGSSITETIKFSKTLTTSGDYIYVNSLLFPDRTENNFTDIDRKFPVEFSFTQNVTIVNTFEIPDGYVVDVLPKSKRTMLQDKELSVSFLIKNDGKTIQVSYNFKVTDCLIGIENYQFLKSFWEQLLEINNEQIVLKRVQAQ